MASYRLLTYASKTGPRAGILIGDAVIDAEAAFGAYAKKTKKKIVFPSDSTLSLFPEARSTERNSADAGTQPSLDNHQSRARR